MAVVASAKIGTVAAAEGATAAQPLIPLPPQRPAEEQPQSPPVKHTFRTAPFYMILVATVVELSLLN